ncbi:MAG TPA: hypothetical protein VNZ54_00765, partial [bacterium]|nr:hypothetical protein [bacterium]
MICIYRACNAELDPADFKAERPPWFDKRRCFQSLRQASQGQDLKIHVLFDGDADCAFARYLRAQPLAGFTGIDYRNNGLSLLACYELAESLDDDSVYFLEDDYLHQPGSIGLLKEGLAAVPEGLFTLYDHPDRYTRADDLDKGGREILLTAGSHWRSSESTTCTVAMAYPVFRRIRRDMMMFTNHDRAMFRFLSTDRGRTLYSALPGAASHLSKEFL